MFRFEEIDTAPHKTALIGHYNRFLVRFSLIYWINTTLPELISAHAHLGNPSDCSSAPKFGSVHCCKPTNHNHGIQTAWIIVSGLIINVTNRPITRLFESINYCHRILSLSQNTIVFWLKGLRSFELFVATKEFSGFGKMVSRQINIHDCSLCILNLILCDPCI